MKFVVNISSIIIMLLSLSTITSAQNQQRPSQRSFAAVLSKIKEKKSGRDRSQRQNHQPEEKIEGSMVQQPVENNTIISSTSAADQPVPPARQQVPSRKPMILPSRRQK
jgi:hypothetical protein